MTSISEIILAIESHPVLGTAILGSIGYTVVGLSKIIYQWFRKEGLHVKPAFWSLGKKYRISAVLKFTPSDNAGGYSQEQFSRQDQWASVIVVRSNYFNMRHTIIPVVPTDVVTVNISRDGIEHEKMISFNR
jgi:hypothetical protein